VFAKTGGDLPKATPLNATHRAAGARMVDFGGWDMPVHYGSQVEEHHAVRREAGLFDVSHMLVVDVTGKDARAFLQALLANDVGKLKTPGKALYSCMLTEKGGVVDDLIVYRFDDEIFRVVVNAGTADKDLAWMEKVRSDRRAEVAIEPRRDLAIIAIQGPQARERFGQAFPETLRATEGLAAFSAVRIAGMMIARTGYTGEDGFEVIVPVERAVDIWAKLVAAGARPAGLGARDTLRLEAGMNLYGQDMDENVSPLDAGLAWTVDLGSERPFIGRQALEAGGQARQFVGLLLLDAGGVLRAHQKVKSAAGEGEVTSGTFSPTLGRSIALARVPLAVKPGDTVQVLVRDKALAARVVKPPFVRNGRTLVNLDKEAP
jgi:aminomethyltransferase